MAEISPTYLTQVSSGGPRWYNAGDFLAGLRRLIIFTGGYGSGKSEVAVNFALSLATLNRPVAVADLDIVNPYFRSREARQVLEQHGIQVMVPPATMMETDLPMIGAEIRGAMISGSGFLVLDLGGDPAGAKVMASLIEGVDRTAYNSFFILNSRRPFSRTVTEVRGLLDGIEAVSGLMVTHLVVNSHLIEETDEAVVREGIKLAEDVSAVTGKPLGFVAVEYRLLGKIGADSIGYPVLAMERQLLKPWERGERLGPERFKI